MTELLTLTPWPDGETLVEALGGAGGGIKEPSPTELGAGGAGGGILTNGAHSREGLHPYYLSSSRGWL